MSDIRRHGGLWIARMRAAIAVGRATERQVQRAALITVGRSGGGGWNRQPRRWWHYPQCGDFRRIDVVLATRIAADPVSGTRRQVHLARVRSDGGHVLYRRV